MGSAANNCFRITARRYALQQRFGKKKKIKKILPWDNDLKTLQHQFKWWVF